MNQKSIKEIRNKAAEVYGIEKSNPLFKKIVQGLKKEYLSTPRGQKKAYKENGI